MKTLMILLMALGTSRCLGGDARIVEVFGSTETISIIENAQSVTVCRLERSTKTGPWRDWQFRAIARHQASDAEMKTIKSIVLESANYRFDVRLMIIPDYDVRLEFNYQERRVSMDVDLPSGLIRVFGNGTQTEGLLNRSLDRLSRICSDSFPKDVELSNLDAEVRRITAQRDEAEQKHAGHVRK